MPSIIDSPAQPDLVHVHWIQVAAGTLQYHLNSRPDQYHLNSRPDTISILVHSVHQVARFVHNPSSSHVKALDYILHNLVVTSNLCLIIGNWTPVDLRFLLWFHLNADASHKNVE